MLACGAWTPSQRQPCLLGSTAQPGPGADGREGGVRAGAAVRLGTPASRETVTVRQTTAFGEGPKQGPKMNPRGQGRPKPSVGR